MTGTEPETISEPSDIDPAYDRAVPSHLAEVRRVVEYHGGTWRADNPSLAVDNAIDAEKERNCRDRLRIAAALGLELDDHRHLWPRTTDDLVAYIQQVMAQRERLDTFRAAVADLLAAPAFVGDDEIVTALRDRLGTEDGCYPNGLEPCTNPGHTHVPAAAARLRELVAVCEAGGGDGWMETPWPRARELAADLRVVLGALGQGVGT